jgi:hypothetical protein
MKLFGGYHKVRIYRRKNKMATRKTKAVLDLENKIAELQAKLDQRETQQLNKPLDSDPMSEAEIFNSEDLAFPDNYVIPVMSMVPYILNLRASPNYRTPGGIYSFVDGIFCKRLIPYGDLVKIIEPGSPGDRFLRMGLYVILSEKFNRKFNIKNYGVSQEQITTLLESKNISDDERLSLYQSGTDAQKNYLQKMIYEKLFSDIHYFTDNFILNFGRAIDSDPWEDIEHMHKAAEQQKIDEKHYQTKNLGAVEQYG